MTISDLQRRPKSVVVNAAVANAAGANVSREPAREPLESEEFFAPSQRADSESADREGSRATLEELEAQIATYSQQQAWREAASASAYIAEFESCRPSRYREASHFFLLAGELPAAEIFAKRASELDVENAEYVLHHGVVLNAAGKHVEATEVILRIVNTDPVFAEAFQQLAFASEKLDRANEAADLALRALRLDPHNENRRLAAAHLLARISRLDEAIETLDDLHGASSPGLRRALSGFLSEAGRVEAALREIDLALSDAALCAEYHLHRSWLLARMGRWREALASVRQALSLDPRDVQAKRHAIAILVETGDVADALRHCGELIALAPDNLEYRDCMRFLLAYSSQQADALELGDIAALKASAAPRPLRPPTTFGAAAFAQARSTAALVLRDIRSRYGDSRLGFLWALMEPFIHVGVLAVVFQFTMHGRPPLGSNFFFFYFTGVMPYLLLSHLIVHLGHSVRSQKMLLQIPTITPLDILLAKSIVELFTTVLLFLVFLGLFLAFGVDARPTNIVNLMLAFALTWVLGFGLGSFCAVLFEFGAVGEQLVGILVRLLYFVSGIFYVPGAMPAVVRDIVAYNPFMHIVDCMRMGFFPTYAPEWTNMGYACLCSLGALLIGMSAVTLFSSRMRAPV